MANEVFFLGAGFSKAIDNNYPTLQKLTTEINNNLVSEKHSIAQHFINEIPLAYKQNIELLLSFLDSNLPYKTPAQMNTDRALYKHITASISNYFKKQRSENCVFREIHKNLANYMKSCKCTCITLNYDILLEDLIYSTTTTGYKQANKNYSIFYKVPIIELQNRVPDSYGAFASAESDFHKDKMPEIIKLHGSINWLTDNNSVYSETGTEDKYLGLGLENFIIPPTLDKTKLYDTALLKILWKKAFDKVLEAEKIYICGFSFPVTDLSIRYLFQSALNNNKNNHDDKRNYRLYTQ